MSDQPDDPFQFDNSPDPEGNPFGFATEMRSADNEFEIATTEQELADLMGTGETPADRQAEVVDDEELDRRAAEAAAEMVSEDVLRALREQEEQAAAEQLEAEAEVDHHEDVAIEEPEFDHDEDVATEELEDEPQARLVGPVDSRKLQALRLLMIANAVMIALMLALPHPLETRPEYRTADEVPSPVLSTPRTAQLDEPLPVAPPSIAVPPAAPIGETVAPEPTLPTRAAERIRQLELGMPDDTKYEAALLLALDGRFDAAATALEEYLAVNPDMNPALRRLVHAHLGYYLRRAGRVTDAIDHENRMRALAGRATLPEELLESARAAERSGDGVAMRRAYAQFLLQREQLSPAMRELVQEAYLRLGDSYRVEADGHGESGR